MILVINAIIRNMKIFFLIVSLFVVFSMKAMAEINIVAAENTYGEVASELGGPYVRVVSILNNPSQDPHLFTTTPSMAKALTRADIVIYNGADYDPWIMSLLMMRDHKDRMMINVASLMQIKPGENPHIWYLPTTMPTFANALTIMLIRRDPSHQAYYSQKFKRFMQSYQRIFLTVKRLKAKYQHTPVIATEPIFDYMAKSIGLSMHGEAFQMSIMNDVPPSVSQIKSFEDDISHHTIRILIYNNQVINPLTEHMRQLAEKEKIPVIGVSEMMPQQLTYVQWIMNELTALENGLRQQRN
jgi:zinc/manganese transport system substrate-binding protein